MRTLTLLAGYAFALLLVYREAYAEAVVVYVATYPAYWLVERTERRFVLARDDRAREWHNARWLERTQRGDQ